MDFVSVKLSRPCQIITEESSFLCLGLAVAVVADLNCSCDVAHAAVAAAAPAAAVGGGAAVGGVAVVPAAAAAAWN